MIIKLIKYGSEEDADRHPALADYTKVIIKSDVADLSDMLMEMDAFIKACGFQPRGELTYLEEHENDGFKE